jgi:polar amino acid transport system substrate-binding protein
LIGFFILIDALRKTQSSKSKLGVRRMKKVFVSSILLVVVLVLGACAPAASNGGDAAPDAAPVTVGAPVAQVPAGDLVRANYLTVCSDIPYPPQEFYDENGDPQGVDIDIANEIGNRLGLKVQFVNTVFDTIIAAVTSGKCDIIVSAMNITKDRNKQISMIPYFKAGQSLVVAKGNPEKISSVMDLCGKSVAAESGTTEVDFIQGSGDYEGNGLMQKCAAEGKGEVNLVITQKDSDSLQQLQTGKVAAYSTDSPVAAYYTVQHPDQFEIAGEVFETVNEGIGLPCQADDCTDAPLTAVGEAVKTALISMFEDGTFQSILDEWNLSSSGVSPQ